MRTSLVTALAALTLSGAATAGASGAPERAACDTKRVQTLSAEVTAKAPTSYHAGRTITVPVQVARGVVPAEQVNIALTLQGSNWFGYGYGVTSSDGKAMVALKVPAKARGAARLTVDAYHPVAQVLCLGFEEFDLLETAYGQAVR